MQNNIIQYAISGALLLGTIASLGEPSDSKPSAAITTRVETYLDGREINAAILIGRNNHRVLAKGYGIANFELAVPITTTTKFRASSDRVCLAGSCNR